MPRTRSLKAVAAGCVLQLAFVLAATADVLKETSEDTVESADLILTHGRIKTLDGWAQALAVRKGIIVSVGDATAIDSLRTAMTEVIDLNGRAVLPGLHDVHVHPVYAGISERRCRVAQGSSLAVTQAGVKGCAQKLAPGAWVIGGQWDASALGRAPNRTNLDRAAPEHPVFLEDTSGHSVWVNSRALTLAGIAKGTPDPVGGIVERDAKGEPTGVLREAAVDLVKQHIPPATEAEVQSALASALRTMLSFGITSFTEASVGFTAGSEKELEAYAALADQGLLKQRARLCLTWTGDASGEALITSRNRYARARLSTDCVKIFLDGVPTDSHTAAMLEPYQDTVAGRDDAAGRMGMLMVEQNALNAAVTRFDRMGLTVKFHAAGDAAVRAGLNAIEAARKANGFSAQMHNVGHCTFVAPEDIARARAIGATFEVSPYLWGPTPINDDITKAVGPTLIKRVWPVREMIESGALVVPGSDWSVVPSVSPWIGIETLVTREKPGGSETSFGKDEAISLEQALELFTANAARQEGMASQVGRLEAGMLADLIVLDQNPYEAPIRQVHATRVAMTFINGEKVFDASSPASIAAGDDDGSHWLMMVKTNSTDPQREAQFNDWYDRIDIPDVLEVPGYMRARRGVAAQEFNSEDGKYVALYDIESQAIDKTLIEMLMATRKMEQRGRSTDLLKVTERVYYHRYAPPFEAAAPKAAGENEYLYVVKVDCCRDAADRQKFNDWYDSTYIPAALAADGAMRATRYELYRVLMIEQHEVPQYLTVFEIKAASPEQAAKNLRQAVARLGQSMDPRYAEAGATLYLKIKDVPRPLQVETFAGGFATVNSFIFNNGRSLVVLDAQRKTAEAKKLAALIRSQYLPLTDILISHGHTDHFTGMAWLHQEFPDARIVVASDAIKRDIKNYAIYMDTGGQTGAEPALEPALRPKSASNAGGFDYENTIQVLKDETLSMEGGGNLEITADYPPTEAPHMSTVYSKELNALFLTDFGYNNVHPWMGDDITRERIAAWRAELLRIKSKYAALNPRVYPGHGEPTDLSLLDRMIGYFDDFTRVTAQAGSAQDAMQRMKALYPGYGEADFFLRYSVENHVK